jgi:AcrR family transcriptional regulator
MTERRPYHHGDLRRTVLDSAIEVIVERGPGAVSLRGLASRAGVSHAAPAHHFGDKAGLLTAIAVEGNELLAASLAGAGRQDLVELGVHYVRFALAHPAHYEVMYRPDLLRTDDPVLLASQEKVAEVLSSGVAMLPTGQTDPVTVRIAAWSAAHGFATLWRTGSLTALAGDRAPDEVFRAVAATMFR